LNRVQFGGDEVVKAKDGAGSATLSMAMAGARFAESLLKAAQGEKGVVEPTFVDSPLYKDQGIDFFASKVELGPSGVEKIHEVGKLAGEEQKLLDACLSDLKKVCIDYEISCPIFACYVQTLTFYFTEHREGCLLRCSEPWQINNQKTYTIVANQQLAYSALCVLAWTP
jgi:hypothetical protein